MVQSYLGRFILEFVWSLYCQVLSQFSLEEVKEVGVILGRDESFLRFVFFLFRILIIIYFNYGVFIQYLRGVRYQVGFQERDEIGLFDDGVKMKIY